MVGKWGRCGPILNSDPFFHLSQNRGIGSMNDKLKAIETYLKRRIEECRDLSKAPECNPIEQVEWAARTEALQGVYLTFFDNKSNV